METSNYYGESLWAVFATLVFTSRSRKLGSYLLLMAANHAEFPPVRAPEESQRAGRKRQHLNDLAWHPLTIKAIGCPCRTSASRDRQPDQGGATIARTPKAAKPLSVGWTFSVNIERQVGVRLKYILADAEREREPAGGCQAEFPQNSLPAVYCTGTTSIKNSDLAQAPPEN